MKWFQRNKRDFPWRKNPSPYRVWVSEIMLQQTLAQVVVPYFERWMALFPTIDELAEAPLEKVIKAWEGLGYYSRARNLHAGAKQIVNDYKGQIPETEEELKKIKGIGDYTAGAILSFAFHKKAPAVDGNVIRVVSRLKAIEEDIGQAKTVAAIRRHTAEFLSDEKPWVVMEALIELGATVCRKKPLCEHCPLQETCRAYMQGCENELPYKLKKIRYEALYRAVFVVKCRNHFLLRVPKKGEIMQDLHEFPYIGISPKEMSHAAALEHLNSEYGLKVCFEKKLQMVKHSFTRFRAQLFPFIFETGEMPDVKAMKWVFHEDLQSLSFSSGHRRILMAVLKQKDN